MIGLLDSGLGGLSALSALKEIFPRADLLYLADRAHAPYGERSPKELLGYLQNAIDFFSEKGVDALLLACGTLSTVALPMLKSKPSFPLFEVTEPVTEATAKASLGRGVAVLATTASIESHVYARLLRQKGVDKVEEQACPLFVPLIEQGFLWNSPVAQEAVRHYLTPLRKANCPVLLLGCTHYGFLAPAMKQLWPEAVQVDSGRTLAHYAAAHLPPQSGEGKCLVYTTGSPVEFLKKISALPGLSRQTVYHL